MRFVLITFLLLCLSGLLTTSSASPNTPQLEVFPQHFMLHPGEQIHYQVLERPQKGSRPQTPCRILEGFGCPDVKFGVENPNIVRLIDTSGVYEAVRPGRTQFVFRTATLERRIAVEVAGPVQPSMMAVPHATIGEIVAKDLLFVGHANLDGMDHTAVAKPGIDGLVQEAKKNGWTVAYFVSQEYPDWYTADRHPDYAIISEGQEHQIRVDAERVIFTGGDFMACTLRNVQMTLQGMLKRDPPQRIHFVFPTQAIWVQDQWWPGEKQPYPAPMLVLTSVFARRTNDAQSYSEVVVPFLDRVINDFPVWDYPPNQPGPPLSDLLMDRTIVVRFGHRFERVYRQGDPNETLLLEFQGL
jgi:hypothetical protein